MHPKTFSLLLLGGSLALALAGCETIGTSSAGYSRDEDAYAPSVTPQNSRSIAAGNTLFNQQHGQLYGASPFPATSHTAASDTTEFDNLEFVSPGLKSQLAVTRVGSDRTDNNLLSVFAGLKNKSGHRLPLEVQTVYKDNSDHSLSAGKSSWVPLTLPPHGVTQYRSVAISEDATDFTVRVRKAASGDSAQP